MHSVAGENTLCNNDYVCSVYFMTTVIMTAGFGDVYPRALREMILIAFMMLMGKFVMSIIIGDMSAIVQNYSYTLSIFDFSIMVLRVRALSNA